MIGLLLPSRGLISSRCVEALDRELFKFPHERFYTHAQPIPDAFEQLALKIKDNKRFTHAWFVEEDVVPPPNSLQELLNLNADISFLNYPLKNYPDRPCYGTVFGEVYWVGLGCTLIRREVFEQVPQPYFDTRYRIAVKHPGSAQKEPTISLVEQERPYGGQDVYFCYQAKKHGFSIDIVPELMCKHPVPPNGNSTPN